jgi:cell division protein FtsL
MARTEGVPSALVFGVRKDIHNNPVRELDRARHHQMWMAVAVVCVLVVAVLVSAWQHFELRRLGFRLEQLQKERADEEVANRHLRLELETLRSPGRIEQRATTELHLVAPGPADTTVIERVRQAPGAPRAMVASR